MRDTVAMVQQELRIALVLNGGVSLAVWMGGVVHELDLLRRASAPRSADGPGPRDYDEATFARWRELSRSGGTESNVVVDVVAGTSAGGLNGSLLATAIAGGGTLDPAVGEEGPWLRERWAELGALSRLLPDGSKPVPSVLDGGYFLDQLREVLGRVAQVEPGTPSHCSSPHPAWARTTSRPRMPPSSSSPWRITASSSASLAVGSFDIARTAGTRRRTRRTLRQSTHWPRPLGRRRRSRRRSRRSGSPKGWTGNHPGSARRCARRSRCRRHGLWTAACWTTRRSARCSTRSPDGR